MSATLTPPRPVQRHAEVAPPPSAPTRTHAPEHVAPVGTRDRRPNVAVERFRDVLFVPKLIIAGVAATVGLAIGMPIVRARERWDDRRFR